MIDRTGTQLERFLTHGIDAEAQAAIGDLPRGRGILGVLIREAPPLRLHDLREDPRSVGFPPGHPPMRSFLGVPVMLRGRRLRQPLSDREGGRRGLHRRGRGARHLLAGQAAVAIENARLYEASTRWSRQLESLNEIGNALADGDRPRRLLDLVARRLRELIEARLVAVLLPAGRTSCASRRPPARARRSSSARRCRAASRRPAACSSGGAASGSTRCSTTPR